MSGWPSLEEDLREHAPEIHSEKARDQSAAPENYGQHGHPVHRFGGFVLMKFPQGRIELLDFLLDLPFHRAEAICIALLSKVLDFLVFVGDFLEVPVVREV